MADETTLVERLREAADRIEVLEGDQAEDDERIALLEQHTKNQKARIKALEAALREIVMLSDITNMSKMYQVRDAANIARAALEGR